MLDAGRTGNPDYDRMSPEFAQVARGQLPYWHHEEAKERRMEDVADVYEQHGRTGAEE
jgi:hypothetical protein